MMTSNELEGQALSHYQPLITSIKTHYKPKAKNAKNFSGDGLFGSFFSPSRLEGAFDCYEDGENNENFQHSDVGFMVCDFGDDDNRRLAPE